MRFLVKIKNPTCVKTTCLCVTHLLCPYKEYLAIYLKVSGLKTKYISLYFDNITDSTEGQCSNLSDISYVKLKFPFFFNSYPILASYKITHKYDSFSELTLDHLYQSFSNWDFEISGVPSTWMGKNYIFTSVELVSFMFLCILFHGILRRDL